MANIRRMIGVVTLGTVIAGGGFLAGRSYEAKRAVMPGTDEELTRLERIAARPTAKGFLDVPNQYQFDWRLNRSEEREVYLQRRTPDGTTLEVAVPENLMELIVDNGGKAGYLAKPARWAVRTLRKGYAFLGGSTYAPHPVKR